MRNISVDQRFRWRCCLKIFIIYLFLALVAIFSGERNDLCNFCEVHYGEHSCEIILNLVQKFRSRYCLKKKFTHNRQRPITITSSFVGILVCMSS